MKILGLFLVGGAILAALAWAGDWWSWRPRSTDIAPGADVAHSLPELQARRDRR